MIAIKKQSENDGFRKRAIPSLAVAPKVPAPGEAGVGPLDSIGVSAGAWVGECVEVAKAMLFAGLWRPFQGDRPHSRLALASYIINYAQRLMQLVGIPDDNH